MKEERKKKEDMDLLHINDFKDSKIGANAIRFDFLLEVCRVAEDKLIEQEPKVDDSNKIIKEDTKQRKSSKNKNAGSKRKLDDQVKETKHQEERLRSKRRKTNAPKVISNANPPPDLPENVKDHIVRMGMAEGRGWNLVIQKPLFYSDTNPSASRFSIPFCQMRTHQLLNNSELEAVEGGMLVRFLDPSLNERTLTFKRWSMNKCSMYVLKKGWNSVVDQNMLAEDDLVQLWSFRDAGSNLCFALVKLEEINVQQ